MKAIGQRHTQAFVALLALVPSPGCIEPQIFAGREAGDTYSKLAEVHVKQDSKADAAQAYVEAAKAYNRVDKSSEQCGVC